jgi:hypothetical protein
LQTQGSTNIWHQGWYCAETLGLEGDLKIQWENYLLALQRENIRLLDCEDELVWQKAPHGVYTPKLGYTTLSIDLLQEEPLWWWKGLWKLKAPLKSKLFMWTTLSNKVPTWDKMWKCQIEGPGWCSLCKGDSETIITFSSPSLSPKKYGGKQLSPYKKVVPGMDKH